MPVDTPMTGVLLDRDKARVDIQPESALFQAALASLLRLSAGGDEKGDAEESKRLVAALAKAEGLDACRLE
jgi:hypothetical protein